MYNVRVHCIHIWGKSEIHMYMGSLFWDGFWCMKPLKPQTFKGAKVVYMYMYMLIMHTCIFFRVLRQIFQSLKQIADVILLLLFIIAFFALIGKF